tara:strand:+ start:269 stop:565 length:297 start_codon:yes stop_codon:yes gene_type:complete
MIIEYKSLYHYLGKPAGGELGRKVAEEATSRGLKLGKLDVSKDLVPSGFVYTYPIDFLDEYFNDKNEKTLVERIRVLEEKVKKLEGGKIVEKEDDLPF